MFEKAMNFLRSYSMRVPMWIRLIFIGIAFGIPAYWAITDTGFYHTLTVWQLGFLDGEYYPVLSYFLPCIFFLLPALAIIMVLGTFFPERHPDETKMGRGL